MIYLWTCGGNFLLNTNARTFALDPASRSAIHSVSSCSPPSSYSVLVFLLVDAIEGFLRLPLDESRRTPWLCVAPLAEVLFPRFLSFVPSLFLVSIPMPGSFLFPRFPTCRLLTSLLLSPVPPYFFQFPSSAIAFRVRPMRIFLSVTRHYL